MHAWIDYRGGDKVEYGFDIFSIIELVANICSLMVCPINILNKGFGNFGK
jgi:hypothetical protein